MKLDSEWVYIHVHTWFVVVVVVGPAAIVDCEVETEVFKDAAAKVAAARTAAAPASQEEFHNKNSINDSESTLHLYDSNILNGPEKKSKVTSPLICSSRYDSQGCMILDG